MYRQETSESFFSKQIFVEGEFKSGYLLVNEGRIEAVIPELPKFRRTYY